MIQYYLDLEKQVKQIAAARLCYGQIQKIYSTAFFVSFSIRAPGKTWHLYLGRGGGYEGVWLHDQAPDSELRRKDNFLEYLRRHVSSCSFVSLELDRSDRIVKLAYQKWGQEQSLLFFWKARKLYFVHFFQEAPELPHKLLLSWRGRAFTPQEEVLDLYDFFNEVGRRTDMAHDLRSPHPVELPALIEGERQAAALRRTASTPSRLQRKLENIEGDLLKARQWHEIQKVLERGDNLSGQYEIKVGDHKIKFEGDLNSFERRNLLFEKIKKLKRGESILAGRLAETAELLAGKAPSTKAESSLPMIKPVWGRDQVIRPPDSGSTVTQNDDFKVYQFEGYAIGVGATSTGNDQLRNKWASKEDVWVHLEGAKSAHAVIKLQGSPAITPWMLDQAASIVAYFSHFTADWIPIIYTPVKNLKGVSGSPGMVTYKKEKHLRCQKVSFKEEL